MRRKIGRRSLLLGTGSLGLTQLISSCFSRQQATPFSVEFLASSVPVTLLKQFQATLPSQTVFKPLPIRQLPESRLLANLISEQSQSSDSPLLRYVPWRQSSSSRAAHPHVVSLGDAWLQRVIQTEQIQPLVVASESGWDQLPFSFQALVRRNAQGYPDESGSIWAAPYRWGQLMIVYRVDQLTERLGWTPTDWIDLWNESLRDRIVLLDHERVVIGLALKTLDQSINALNLKRVTGLTSALGSLHQQVRFYSSDTYLQPLLLDDVWVAVGWSPDILPLVRRDRRLAAVVPESGTILTADMWVQPHASNNESSDAENSNNGGGSTQIGLVYQWIEFFWNLEVATQLSLLSTGASPIVLAPDIQKTLLASLRNDTLLIPSATTLEASEFLLPLPKEAIAQYQQYWQTMRQSKR